MCVEISADFGVDCESRWHRQPDPRHLMEVRAFAAQQRFLRAFSISMTIPEVINVTRRTRSLSRGDFARAESDRFPRALKSTISFPFCGHNLAAAATAEMTKRQTKFGRRDVNAAENQRRAISHAFGISTALPVQGQHRGCVMFIATSAKQKSQLP